jgi:phosphoribosyl 1,2-cyclic phosphodiesterase
MIGFCPLASGSKGNCIYIGTKKTKILVDAGISMKNIKEKLLELGTSIEKIDAIMISHEHTDHIAGLRVLASKLGIPIIANTETAKAIVEQFHECPNFKIFITGETFEFQDLEIHPFTVQHDARDPVAFTIKTEHEKLGICTDLGFATSLVQNHLKNCHILYVEANHKPSMVHASSRPASYKQRVLSRTGHLSNEACGELLAHVAHDAIKQVYLAHLSSECNTPDTALNTVSSILQLHGIALNIAIAHQEVRSKATPLLSNLSI